MIELLIAMTMLSVAIGALITTFAASAVSLRRAGQKGTALTLADTQMERYRTRGFTSIRIDGTLVPGVGDVRRARMRPTRRSLRRAVRRLPVRTATTPARRRTSRPPCLPVQNVTGPDGHTYRVDAYVNYVNNDATLSVTTPASGLTLKRVTVVVRDGTSPGMIMARESSAFGGP